MPYDPGPPYGAGTEEPSADARAAARVYRDLFVALTQEGFTEGQALHILGVMIATANGGNS